MVVAHMTLYSRISGWVYMEVLFSAIIFSAFLRSTMQKHKNRRTSISAFYGKLATIKIHPHKQIGTMRTMYEIRTENQTTGHYVFLNFLKGKFRASSNQINIDKVTTS